MGQIEPKYDKCGTFSDQISIHFASASQDVLKYDLKKSQICPVWANLTHFGPKSDIPEMGLDCMGSFLRRKGNEVGNLWFRSGNVSDSPRAIFHLSLFFFQFLFVCNYIFTLIAFCTRPKNRYTRKAPVSDPLLGSLFNNMQRLVTSPFCSSHLILTIFFI